MSAPLFPADTPRYDPYRNYRFKVKWDGRYVAGVNKMTPPERAKPIILEQGVTQDAAFEQWVNSALTLNSAPGDFRQDILIELYNEAGQCVVTYTVNGGRPVKSQFLPELDGMSGSIAIQTLALEYDSWDETPA